MFQGSGKLGLRVLSLGSVGLEFNVYGALGFLLGSCAGWQPGFTVVVLLFIGAANVSFPHLVLWILTSRIMGV